jgi:gluconolactonase
MTQDASWANAKVDTSRLYDPNPGRCIQPVHPDAFRLVEPDAKLTWLDKSLGGKPEHFDYPWMPAEGPVWIHEAGHLLLSDIGKDQRMKWSPQGGMTVDARDTNSANGLTRDRQGRLIICEQLTQRLTRRELDGSMTVLADKYQGKRLSRPNDVIVKSDNSIYFTDPDKPIYTKVEQDFAGVYRLSPDGQTLTLLCKDLLAPNGLCFSPGETVLYVNDTFAGAIYAYDMNDDGTLGARRTFAFQRDDRLGIVDGMKVDLEGNVYCTGPGGVWIVAPDGRQLCTIALGEGIRSTNLCWGGSDWRTLFITSKKELCSIRMKVRGVPVPAGIAP